MPLHCVVFKIRELETLLSGGKNATISTGRIIWTGSQTSDDRYFQWSDPQALKR